MFGKEKEAKRVQAEIRRVLVDVWYPIGIKNVTEAEDEYDAYIRGVYRLLASGGSDQEIASYLWKVIEERIHIHPASGATDETVKALRRIRIV